MSDEKEAASTTETDLRGEKFGTVTVDEPVTVLMGDDEIDLSQPVKTMSVAVAHNVLREKHNALRAEFYALKDNLTGAGANIDNNTVQIVKALRHLYSTFNIPYPTE